MAVAHPTTVSLRLNKQLAKRLNEAAKAAGVSKSEYLRQSLIERLEEAENSPSIAWEVGKDLFGCCASESGDLSIRAKELARERIHANFLAENPHRQRANRRSVRQK